MVMNYDSSIMTSSLQLCVIVYEIWVVIYVCEFMIMSYGLWLVYGYEFWFIDCD